MKHSMKIALAAAAVAGASLFSAAGASAMPMGMSSQASATVQAETIGWRCGPGMHAAFGRCVPNRAFGYGRPGWRRPGWRRHW